MGSKVSVTWRRNIALQSFHYSMVVNKIETVMLDGILSLSMIHFTEEKKMSYSQKKKRR